MGMMSRLTQATDWRRRCKQVLHSLHSRGLCLGGLGGLSREGKGFPVHTAASAPQVRLLLIVQNLFRRWPPPAASLATPSALRR